MCKTKLPSPIMRDCPRGRFAPSPTGRMHLGNVYAALMSWLSVKLKGGKWVLRIEDLDSCRSRREYAEWIEDDLRWLGLEPDEGGLEDRGPGAPYSQSKRTAIYSAVLEQLASRGLTYFCRCRRADILATQAPHQSDGRVVYSGRCREAGYSDGATRLVVPDRMIEFTDEICGSQSVNLVNECGDFVVRRADGEFAYQLAVVVDDALMGITEVVRGNDLLLSAAQQCYVYDLMGWERPVYAHFPLLCNKDGQRLSKRDKSLAMDELRSRMTPEEIIGRLAYMSRLVKSYCPMGVNDMTELLIEEGHGNPSAGLTATLKSLGMQIESQSPVYNTL